MDENWELKAAREIDTLLAKAVEKNMGAFKGCGCFCGVSIKDIADIIQKHESELEIGKA